MANLYSNNIVNDVNSVNNLNDVNSVIILGQSNIIQLCNICERFFLEKYNINVTQDTLTKTVPILLQKIIAYYGKNPPLPNIQEVNKIAMQRMKDFILSRMQQEPAIINKKQQPQQPPILTPLPPPMSTQTNNINTNTSLQTAELKYNPYDLHNPTTPTSPIDTTNLSNTTNLTNPIDINKLNYTSQNIETNETPIDKVSEDQFFIKLKNLENTRNITSSIKTTNSEQFLVQNTAQSLNQSFQQQLQPVIIQQLLPVQIVIKVL